MHVCIYQFHGYYTCVYVCYAGKQAHMHVCMYRCRPLHACKIYACIHIVYTCMMYVCMYVCMYVHTYVRTYVCVHVCRCVYLIISLHKTCVHLSVCLSVCLPVFLQLLAFVSVGIPLEDAPLMFNDGGLQMNSCLSS